MKNIEILLSFKNNDKTFQKDPIFSFYKIEMKTSRCEFSRENEDIFIFFNYLKIERYDHILGTFKYIYNIF